MPASTKLEPRWTRNIQAAKYLGVSNMTFWRWARDPELGFPLPTVIGGKEYRDLNEIDAWMKSMVRRPQFTTRNKRKQKLILDDQAHQSEPRPQRRRKTAEA